MQPINLTDEQRELRAVVRRFAEDKVLPHAAEADRTAEYNWASWEALKSMELTGLSYPEKYGGAGATLVDQAIVAEELARVDASTSLAFLVNKLGMLPVLNFGSDWMKETYLPGICDGSSQASYGLSEPDAGSDVASMTTKAERDGEDWVLTGTKCWITNAGVSDLYTIFARTSPDRHTGITAFLVEADWGVRGREAGAQARHPQLADGRHPPRRRARARPQPHRRGRPGLPHRDAHARPFPPGHRRPGRRHRPGRPGLRRRLHEGAHDVRQADRRAAGPAVDRRRLGDEDRGRSRASSTGRARWSTTATRTASSAMAGAMAKAFASDVAMQVTTDAVQLLGGYGYTSDFPVERMMRDAKITQIYEGTNQIQRIVIARHLLR